MKEKAASASPVVTGESLRTEAIYTDRDGLDWLIGVARLTNGREQQFYSARNSWTYYEALQTHFETCPPTDALREILLAPDPEPATPVALTGPNVCTDAAGNYITHRAWEQLKQKEHEDKKDRDHRRSIQVQGHIIMQNILEGLPYEGTGDPYAVTGEAAGERHKTPADPMQRP